MTKFAFPALILCIVALFFYSVTSQPNDAPDLVEPLAAPTQKVVQAETTMQAREQPPANPLDSIRAELQRLSDDIKANSDKLAQTATLRSDLLKVIQDSKSNDKAAQTTLDQINALRSDQAKFLEDTKDSGDKTAQSLRKEVEASQAKLVAQVGDQLKTDSANSEALSKRVDAMEKDIEQVKKSFDESRQNDSGVSPGVALFAALAALVLGPFIAYRFTENQLSAIRQPSDAGAALQAKTPEEVPPLAPHAASEPQHHETPAVGEQASPHHNDDGDLPV